MAFPQNDLETCNISGESTARRLFEGPFLWDTIFPRSVKSKADWWTCSEILHVLDRACDETELGREFSLGGFEGALICKHREGSYDNLSPDAVTRCLHVACVICFNCVLFLLRIKHDSNGSDLIDDLSRVHEHKWKWNWSGESRKKTFNQWIRYIQSADAEEEVMKLLSQWTVIPFGFLWCQVDDAIDGAESEGRYDEVIRASKWGDELCNIIVEYRLLFSTGDCEYALLNIFQSHQRMALLHRTLGNFDRSKELLETLKSTLQRVVKDAIKDVLMVESCENDKIEYYKPDLHHILAMMLEVNTLLIDQGIVDDSFSKKISKGRKALLSNRGLVIVDEWNLPRFGHEIDLIVRLVMHEQRFSEAREKFKQLDLKQKKLKAEIRSFLELKAISGFCSVPHYGTTLNWETLCERQDLLLEFCDALGDGQLTAVYLHQYAIELFKRSREKLENIQDTPTLNLLLQEELNLQLNSPFPECVQELISCLNDPCKSDEHKRDNLPDTLKACRLFKCSFDIYSDLLHKWTSQGSSNEIDWLKLLESKKKSHQGLQVFELWIMFICWKSLQESNDFIVGADNKLLPTQSAMGSNHSNYVIQRAKDVLMSNLLVWAERGRTRTLLLQLRPWYDLNHRDEKPDPLYEELSKFDKDNEAALSSLLSCRFACKGEPLFIEYLSEVSKEPDNNDTVAFVIHRRAKLDHFCQIKCNGDEMAKLVTDFYKTVLLQRNNADVVVELHSILEKLYDILIEPFWHMYKGLDPKATVVFVPDKMLYRVPFALLRDKITKKHLFQLHPIAIAPSLRVLQHCDKRLRDLDKYPLKADGCILAVGNAAYETNRLPGTAEELEHLQSCFSGHVKTLEKEEATRAKFLELVKETSHSKEGDVFACIHLGVHGHWKKIKPGDDEEAETQYTTGSLQFAKPLQRIGASKGSSSTVIRSGDLVIRQCGTSVLDQEFGSKATICNDGERHGVVFGEVGSATRASSFTSLAEEDMLPSEDIVNCGFQWRTRLVVLSACNSSRGQDYSDGEVNLPRALMIAGVPAAVVSQWKIDDSASPKLMKAFYENLRYGQDVATALQSAMLQLSNENANIFEWGPFLVWGLPSVQLPKELMTENARKAIPARQQAELLRCTVNRLVGFDDLKAKFLKLLKVVDTFIESWCRTCAPELEVIINAIIAVDHMLSSLTAMASCFFSEDIVALAEELYAILPLEQLNRRVRFQGGSPEDTGQFMYNLSRRYLYTQAMKGSYKKALDYANMVIEDIQSEDGTWVYDVGLVQYYKREKAVILRLMGKYEDALKEFDGILGFTEDYASLIQASYLKDVMEDKGGALEYGRRAKMVEGGAQLDQPGRGAFELSFKALPDEYRQWLLKIDQSAEVALPSVCVSISCN